MALEDEVTLDVKGRVAIITLNRPKQLNAMTQAHYFRIAQLLREIGKIDSVVVTLLTGKGRFFSAGADVRQNRNVEPNDDPRRWHLQRFAANNLEVTDAFCKHPKILVTALNGPTVGLSAALVAYSDFIYAAPHTYLLTPFSSLGLIAEGGSSKTFVERMGISKANEALIQSKRLTLDELIACGFVNKVFDVRPGEDEKFQSLVIKEIDDRLGEHLVTSSMLQIKRQIRQQTMTTDAAQQLDEVINGVGRFVDGVPQAEFMKIASGQKRHKL